jgi:hypothetical protein
MRTLIPGSHRNPSPASILGFQRSGATDLSVASDDSSKAESPSGDRSTVLSEPDRALVEAAEEMSFNWAELPPVERIKPAIIEMVLGLLLFAGLVAFGRFLF